MKILGLIPCLMKENTRAINNKSIKKNIDTIAIDGWAVYDQMFEDSDKLPNVSYIADAKEPKGWIASRNGLLEYFYESDYDYAFWIDANSTVSGPTLNDVDTIVKALQSDKLDCCDAIFSTLGMWNSQERKDIKSLPDSCTHVHVIPNKCSKGYNWMHGLFIKNFNKYYGTKFFIDERMDTHKGLAEDVYFARLLNMHVKSYLAPSVVLNKPNSNFSTAWANGTGKYNYPPVKFQEIDRIITENSKKYGYPFLNENHLFEPFILERTEYNIASVKPFKPRTKEKPATPVKSLFL